MPFCWFCHDAAPIISLCQCSLFANVNSLYIINGHLERHNAQTEMSKADTVSVHVSYQCLLHLSHVSRRQATVLASSNCFYNSRPLEVHRTLKDEDY